MPWTRIEFVYCPDGSQAWARSHAALPVPVQIAPGVLRFFFSARDAEQRSSVGWVDVEMSEKPTIVRHSSAPVLVPGEDGTFDDNGVGIGCITDAGDHLRLYYMGWNLGVRAPWRNAIGLAHAPTPNDDFARYSAGPILDRSPEDPYSLSYPWVLRRGRERWQMWYGSNPAASATSADTTHVVKTARSRDGVRWDRDGATVTGLALPEERILARPTVIELNGSLLMCFACRGERYRIGGAWSRDGVSWTRIDAILGLDPSAAGWDSEMTCYPALFWFNGRLWLAYNGNSYGATGFGLAVWHGDPLATILAGKASA